MSNLNNAQLETLGRFFLGDRLKEFYSNPENEAKYREWYLQKYGKYPED